MALSPKQIGKIAAVTPLTVSGALVTVGPIEGYRNIPIVDDRGGPLGVLTVWDVMRHLGDIFDADDATPEMVPPHADISSVVELGSQARALAIP